MRRLDCGYVRKEVEMRFQGKVALITGGGRGIGAATAELFVREGAAVVVCDLDEGPAREVADPLGESALAVACDVTRREDVERAVGRALEAFGRLDILVCCAGITRDNLIHKMSDDDWQSVLATHLTGSYLACQAAQRTSWPMCVSTVRRGRSRSMIARASSHDRWVGCGSSRSMSSTSRSSPPRCASAAGGSSLRSVR